MVVPFGPVWHPGQRVQKTQGEITVSPTPAGTTAAGSPASPAAAEPKLPATPSGIPAPAYGLLKLITPAGTYPHALSVAGRFGKTFGQIKVSIEKDDSVFSSLCNTDSRDRPEFAELPRRVTPAALRLCDLSITELKIGHQAVVLARSKLYGPLRLSARGLFLALARQIPNPNPADQQLMLDNPNMTWNQVDGTLPYDRIHILGPTAGSVQARLATALLLEAGCNTYPWIASLRTTDVARYEEICTSLRFDGAYEESTEGGWAYAENLVRNPTALGIFTLQEFESAQDKLSPIAIDGVAPSLATVVADTYPAARPLYLYTNQRYPANSLLSRAFAPFLGPEGAYGYDPGNWGFVSLDDTERAEAQSTLQRLQHRF